MSKYTFDYACGHGKESIQLFGKRAEREKTIRWLAANKPCPACYRMRLLEQDATAPQELKVAVVCNPDKATLQLEVYGKIAENNAALHKLGYAKRASLFRLRGPLSAYQQRHVLSLQQRCHSIDEAVAWITEQAKKVDELGYTLKKGLSPHDFCHMSKVFAKEKVWAAKAAAIATEAIERKPPHSPLRLRIAKMEKNGGSQWNGKIYGRKDFWNFYLDKTKHPATNAEVAGMEKTRAARKSWNERHPELVEEESL